MKSRHQDYIKGQHRESGDSKPSPYDCNSWPEVIILFDPDKEDDTLENCLPHPTRQAVERLKKGGLFSGSDGASLEA